MNNVLSDCENKNGHGCYALKTTHGKALVELKRGLNKTAAPKGIQLVTISRPNAYGEYAPYRFVRDETEFIHAVHELCK